MGEMSEGNMAIIEVAEQPRLAGEPVVPGGSRPRRLLLVAEDALLAKLVGALPTGLEAIALSQVDPAAIEAATAAGDALIWIGPGEQLPAALSLGCHRPARQALAVQEAAASPLMHHATWNPTRVAGAWIKPPKEMPAHNCDEEVRADFLPLLEARDRLGDVVAYPAVLMNYYAGSLAGGRFKGSQVYLYLFDAPLEAQDAAGWLALLGHLTERLASGLQPLRFTTTYATTQAGERVHARLTLANHRPLAVAVEALLLARGPHESDFRPLRRLRRNPAAGEEAEIFFDVVLPGDAVGLWTLRVEIHQTPRDAELLSVVGSPRPLDARELGVVLLPAELATPTLMEIDGPALRFDGRDDFWVGTHYYPSSSWWEWVWRDFRPALAARDFAAIRREGYRLVRVWIDPDLDEVSLRAMDAAIWLAAQHGLVLDVCIFSQWVRGIGYERPGGEYLSLVYREPSEFNVYGISLRQMAEQREYVALLARRWRAAGNLIYNLSNETYVFDPDASQMDAEVRAWPEAALPNGSARNSLLFRRWGRELTEAMRAAGATQPVMPGYLFSTLKGGDTYLANRDAEILPWHCYFEPEKTGCTLQYYDALCTGRPTLLEEFGTLGWNPTAHYDATAHYALAGGAAAAMSYEWGVSWLAPWMCYGTLSMREADVEHPDPRCFPPAIDIGRSWPARGAGFCLTPSGLGYGSIHHGTPFPGAAAIALARLGRMGQGLARAAHGEAVYVLVPTAACDAMETVLACLRELWQLKVAFGVWHEDQLATLPSSATVLIAPLGVGQAAEAVAELGRRGVEVYAEGDADWRQSPRLARIAVSPADSTRLLVRRTASGTLYTVAAEAPLPAVTVATAAGQLTCGLEGFALLHEARAGINFIEAAGAVVIAGQPFCDIARGRVLIASSAGEALPAAPRLRLLASEPTRITFARPVASVHVEHALELRPAAQVPDLPNSAEPRVLEIDDELCRHVLWVEFA